MVFRWLWSRIFGKGKRVALFVDGPNVFRDEFQVDIPELLSVAQKYGRVVSATAYLDEHATPGLIRAVEANGFATKITSTDVDVSLAVEASAAAVGKTADVIVIVSRDADFKPVLEQARAAGCTTVVIAPGDYGRSNALVATADRSVVLED